MSATRRDFLRSGVMTAALASTASHPVFAYAKQSSPPQPSPIQLGLASYTFRNFDRAHVIEYMKELKLSYLNAKDVKDHLPMTPPAA